MKIAHVSDLHIDAVNKKVNYIRALHLFEYIKENKFDHIIISGDITENGDPASFELARSLFKSFGLLSSDKLSLTIGNHDIYGGVHLAEDIVNYPSKCMQTSFYRKVKQFAFYFRESFQKTISVNDHIFPYIKELDEIIITGFNSNAHYSYFKNPFASNGKISKKQISEAEDLFTAVIKKDKLNIAVTHHHFYRESNGSGSSSVWNAIERQTMKLRRKKKIIKKFSDMAISIVLHGHLHENREYSRKNIKFLNSGGSIDSISSLMLNEIFINKRKIETRIIKIPYPNTQPDKTVNDIFIPAKFAAAKQAFCLN